MDDETFDELLRQACEKRVEELMAPYNNVRGYTRKGWSRFWHGIKRKLREDQKNQECPSEPVRVHPRKCVHRVKRRKFR